MARKQEIKEEIAHLLMRNSVGMLENAIIQQVTATSNVDAITIALNEMASLGEVKRDGKRWKITPIGRSFYSDLNNKKESQPSEAKSKLVAGINNFDETLSPADAVHVDKTIKNSIERVESFRTPDGEIHTTQDAAEMHMLRQQLLPSIDAFMENIGSTCKQKGLIRSYITRWEKFKQEQAA
jgi:hypothetical protein